MRLAKQRTAMSYNSNERLLLSGWAEAKVFFSPSFPNSRIVLLEVIPFEFSQHLYIAVTESLDYRLL